MSISNVEQSNTSVRSVQDVSHLKPSKDAALWSLGLMAIGVVFGDIGTSPLYSLKACFDPVHGIGLTTESVLGVISMIFWAFMIVVSLKYVAFVMRANNHGEGGILALMALAMRTAKMGSSKALWLITIGILGACLFYGDAVITPAISVMSAVEGLSVVSASFTRFVIPCTLIILIALFTFEKKGTAIVGNFFGPIMVTWFLTIGIMGVYQIAQCPSIFQAINPLIALKFMIQDSKMAFVVMGAVFLVLTGAEALYADMGHFGVRPIRMAWFILVMPCLVLNYFGQGALLIRHPEAMANPFFMMVPESFTLSLVILSTVATVIASQACISGAYSMTSQAILLGFVPRMKVLHTSDKEMGQIYVPFINWTLCLIVVIVVLAFQKSDNLASAYGVAVSTTMLMTTILAAVVMSRVWKWSTQVVSVVITLFLMVDFAFFASNLVKVLEGGWFPLAIGAVTFLLLMTWYEGRKLLREHALKSGTQLEDFLPVLLSNPPLRVEGTAIFLTSHIDITPPAMLHNLKHNRVLHERVIFLKVSIWDVPWVAEHEKLAVKDLGHNMYLVKAIYGFKEILDIGEVLTLLAKQFHIVCPLMETSFFMARDSLVAKKIPQMSLWRELLFIWMMQNASRAADFFKIDPGRLIELGAKIEL